MATSSSAESAAEECKICKGARFVHPLLASGKPDYSRIVPCRCANQQTEEKRLSRLQKYSNLGALTRFTFASLSVETGHKDEVAKEQFRLASKAAAEFAKKPSGWLFISGASGSGKTHLAAAIANECLQNNVPAFYTTTPDLLDHLRSSFNPSSELPYDEFFEQVRNAQVLVLDDFGTQSSSSWAKEKLDQLLSHRHANRLATVIISNVPLEELEERVRTRLTNTDFCKVYSLGSKNKELHLYDWAPDLNYRDT